MKPLESRLRELRDAGRKALVPYFVAGLTPDWTRHVEAAVLGGADAVEIGVPFSDPMMDGVVIQEGGLRALERGTTFESICQELDEMTTEVPLIAMTYYNIFLHYGLSRAAGRLSQAGVSGAIVPDLSLEESAPWRRACDEHDVATVFLVAPSTPPDRVAALAQRTEGFAYAAARMAVTGAARDAGEAERVVSSLRAVSDVPVYVGIGITTPEDAARVVSFSDGVIVGSALVKRILDGADTEDVETLVRSFREAIDRGSTTGS
jgi:tryptophan synthase alpha chain